MFLVTYITRAHSSGFENRSNKTFDTLEEVAEYIQGEWYDSFCEFNSYPDNWDEEDFGCPMPKREDFSLDAINKIRSKKFWFGELFGPYSNYCGLVPDELRLEEINVINNIKKAAEPVAAKLARAVALENALVEKDEAYLAAARAVASLAASQASRS